MKSFLRCFGGYGLAIGLLLGGTASVPTWASTITVTNAADIGSGTLRQALADANAGDTIDFNLTYPARIYVQTSLSITRNLTIVGPGAGNLALDGNGLDHAIIQVSNSPTVAISDLTMQSSALSAMQIVAGTVSVDRAAFINNFGYSGAAISNYGGLTVSNSTFTNNSSDNQGGAIYNSANAGLTVINCSFIDNAARHEGGAVANFGTFGAASSTFKGNKSVAEIGDRGGAIFNFGPLTINSSTFTGNVTTGTGGAIWNTGTVTLTSSTLSGNSAVNGGSGIYNFTGFTLGRSIIDGSCGGEPLVSNGDNIGSNSSCITNSTPLNDRAGLDPLLLPLADNGGPTQTMALQESSPAVDQVIAHAATCVGADQRGFVRPRGMACDIGAVEMDFERLFHDGFE